MDSPSDDLSDPTLPAEPDRTAASMSTSSPTGPLLHHSLSHLPFCHASPPLDRALPSFASSSPLLLRVSPGPMLVLSFKLLVESEFPQFTSDA